LDSLLGIPLGFGLVAAHVDEATELADRHRIATEGKGLGDPHPVLWPFVVRAARFGFRRTHDELAGRDDDHLRTRIAVSEHLARRPFSGSDSRRLRVRLRPTGQRSDWLQRLDELGEIVIPALVADLVRG
jgi:hypothetical protein